MEELKKINRIIDREYPEAYRETLVVLDGTTGQNALAQARQFMEVADITGIILTKLDGTAKGGIAVAIQSELGIPVKYVGIGEKIDDLAEVRRRRFCKCTVQRARQQKRKRQGVKKRWMMTLEKFEEAYEEVRKSHLGDQAGLQRVFFRT